VSGLLVHIRQKQKIALEIAAKLHVWKGFNCMAAYEFP
jgi:hypothetical protein